MFINHNISALNTYNRLSAAGKAKSNAMEKISSGIRINKAADDAAGSVISQEMKGQIRGLEQAVRNIQDGISLVQTADSGLADIIDPNLLRLRELSVQASNSTLTQNDLQQIQLEVNQILSGIDSIANDTEFNNIKLLNGTNPKSLTEIQPSQESGENSQYDYKDVLSEPPVSSTGLFNFRTNKGYPTTNEDDSKILVYGSGITSHPLVNIDGNTYDLHHISSSEVTATAKIGDSYNTIYKINNIEVTQCVKIVKDKYEIKYSVKNNDTVEHNIGIQYHIDTMLGNDDQAPFIVNGSKVQNETEYIGTNLPDSFIVYNQNTGVGANAKIQACGIVKGDGIIETPSKLVIGQYNTISDWNHSVNNANLVGDSGYSIMWDSRPVSSSSSFEINTFYGLSIPPTVEDPTVVKPVVKKEGPYDINLQVGANSGNQFLVQLSDVRTEKLFNDGISVLTREDAEKMIDSVDLAMQKVSKERSKYGAYQNALDHIDKNVESYGYNISSAESRITDIDMAKEVMEMTKNSIIEQSAQSILNQAEKMPESIINLMDKWKSDGTS